MRALQEYAPHTDRTGYQRSVQAAAAWLAKAEPRTNEDRAFQLLGLRWAGASEATIVKAARALLAEQRADGGWAQLPSLTSDAYATGEALYALMESGTLRASDAAHRKSIQFLLRTQLEDGSWHVQTRAIPIQPLFDIGFPHGRDSWISAAGTNWATLALALSLDRPHVR
jgi:squalene cyclase